MVIVVVTLTRMSQDDKNSPGTAGHAGPMSEAAFIKSYDASAYPPVFATVDIALFTLREGRLVVLLVERGEPPFQGAWALPGGFVRQDETILRAAERELAEEAGVARFGGHLEQLATYGAPDRDPRWRVISVAHVAIAPRLPEPHAGTDAATARYWAIDELGLERRRRSAPQLAFDHRQILRDALERVRSKLEYTALARDFLEPPFTITALRRVYEAVWGQELDPANFQRKVIGTSGFLEPTDELARPGASGGRQARLYRPGSATALHPAVLRTRA
jgi:8-oxo-dGTP diphosphatase